MYMVLSFIKRSFSNEDGSDFSCHLSRCGESVGSWWSVFGPENLWHMLETYGQKAHFLTAAAMQLFSAALDPEVILLCQVARSSASDSQESSLTASCSSWSSFSGLWQNVFPPRVGRSGAVLEGGCLAFVPHVLPTWLVYRTAHRGLPLIRY